jgi:CBS domain-containing protein
MSLKSILAVKGDEVVSINSNADLAAAAKLLKKRQIGVLVVLDAGGRLVGILSERDIVGAMAENGDAILRLPVSQVMTPKVSTCNLDDSIGSVMERMTEGKFRHMPVLDENRLVGIVSNRDLLKWHLDTIREHIQKIEESFAEVDLMRL